MIKNQPPTSLCFREPGRTCCVVNSSCRSSAQKTRLKTIVVRVCGKQRRGVGGREGTQSSIATALSSPMRGRPTRLGKPPDLAQQLVSTKNPEMKQHIRAGFAHCPLGLNCYQVDIAEVPKLSVLSDIETSGPTLVLVLPVQMLRRALESLECF